MFTDVWMSGWISIGLPAVFQYPLCPRVFDRRNVTGWDRRLVRPILVVHQCNLHKLCPRSYVVLPGQEQMAFCQG